MNINDFYTIRLRINNYLSIISICLCNFSEDNQIYLERNDCAYVQKIEEGRIQMLTLLMELDDQMHEQPVEPAILSKYRHDLRLAVNIIQGYAEVLLEALQEKAITSVGGHFSIIIYASREILKNIELLQDTSDNPENRHIG